jgi:formamidopyrimidine-DNA glycosylase
VDDRIRDYAHPTPVPELPDVTLYVEALERFVGGRELHDLRLQSVFLLRTVKPAPSQARGRRVVGVERLGKRLVLALGPAPRPEESSELFLVIHLMVAGRFQWRAPGAPLNRRTDLAGLDFEHGTLVLTEAGTKKRAALHVVASRAELAALARGGLEPLTCSFAEFRARLVGAPHTLKRALTMPDLFSGIGNAYSDEILHRARLSPLQRGRNLTEEELARLHAATRTVLTEWIDRLRAETGASFPAKVTAFRPEMAVHGRFGKPCPVCAAPVQRIVRAENEVNYCARCQTEGRILRDRALSHLLKEDWPERLEDLEEE